MVHNPAFDYKIELEDPDPSTFTYNEMEHRVAELEAFEKEWKPVLILALQAIASFASSPMFAPMVPPQVKTLIDEITKRGS